MSDANLPDDFDPYKGDMNISNGRDWAAWIAIGVTIIGNIVGIAYVSGKSEQRQENTDLNVAKLEASVADLKRKAEKDSEQDVQIAVISTQLAVINSGVSEIRAKLEARR